MRTPTTTSDQTPGLSRTASGKGNQRLISEEAIETFRALMENRSTNAAAPDGEQKQLVELGQLRVRSAEPENSSATDLTQIQEHQQLPVATLLHAARQTGPVSVPGAANNTAVIDLIEKHVRQLMISEGGLNYRPTSKIVLRLTKNTLAETDLHLSRTDSGWRLHANVRSADAFHAIEEFTPDLTKRFAERSLGAIEVEPELNVAVPHRENPR